MNLREEFKALQQAFQQQSDELAVRNLAHQFSDAANRKDGKLFQSLWAPNGTWVIGPPINVKFNGKEKMAQSVMQMLDLWDFFYQLTGPGVVTLEGGKAKARFYVNEVARGKDGKGNYNLSMYEDRLIKINGVWFFEERTYHTIYQDAPNYTGFIQPLSIESKD